MESIWQLAGMTAAVGMGVVFVALFLLAMYMHYFKILTARIEGRTATPAPHETAGAPSLQPLPEKAAEPPEIAQEARVAAAVAVGLHLQGVRTGPAGEVAAAIAAALATHRARVTAARERAARAPSSWQLAGRMESMHGRLKRHERPITRLGP